MGSRGGSVFGRRGREGGPLPLPRPQADHRRTPVEVHKGKAVFSDAPHPTRFRRPMRVVWL